MTLESILDDPIHGGEHVSSFAESSGRHRETWRRNPAGAAVRGTFASKHPAIVKFASVYRVLLLHRTLAEIGPKFARRIVAMARAGNSAVVVDAVRERHYEENGQSKKESSTFKHRLGNLDGISVLNNDQYIQLSISISNIRQAFTAAVDVQSLTRASQAALTTRLEECEPVLQRAVAIEEQLERFFKNSHLLFCFITDERGERSRLARLAMHQLGVDGGRDQAKEWLLGQEQGLIRQLGVQAIRILGA